MTDRRDPIRPADDAARRTARELIFSARTAALAVIDPRTGAPFASRIAVGVLPGGRIATLVSALSLHTRALAADPRCCLLFGEPARRGDPLNHPRLSVAATARFLDRPGDADRAAREGWLAIHPRSRLYVDFPDFSFAMLLPLSGSLNGGFGRTYSLGPDDLTVG